MFRHERGFTLLEVIIAIGILGSICVLIINILGSQLSMRTRITNMNTMQHSMDVVMARVMGDLRSAYITKFADMSYMNLAYQPVSPKFTLKSDDISFFTFNFRSLTRNTPQGNIAYVRYVVEKDDKTGLNILYRYQDTDLSHTSFDDDGVIKQPMVKDIKKFKVTCWNGRDYVEDWDSTSNDTQNRLPKLVRVHFDVYYPLPAGATADPSTVKDRMSYQLDSIAYLPNAMGDPEDQEPDWSEFKWK